MSTFTLNFYPESIPFQPDEFKGWVKNLSESFQWLHENLDDEYPGDWRSYVEKCKEFSKEMNDLAINWNFTSGDDPKTTSDKGNQIQKCIDAYRDKESSLLEPKGILLPEEKFLTHLFRIHKMWKGLEQGLTPGMKSNSFSPESNHIELHKRQIKLIIIEIALVWLHSVCANASPAMLNRVATNKTLDNLTQNIQELENKFERQIKQQAVDNNAKELKEIWDKAHEANVNAYQRWFLVAFVFMALCGAFVIWGIDCLFPPTTETGFNYINIGRAVIVTTLAIWAARIFTKLGMGSVHLARDASERATVAEVYSNILNQPSYTLDPQESLLFFSHLFHRANTGLIKEDGPTTPLDICANVINKVMPDKDHG